MDQNKEYKIEGVEKGGWLLAALTAPQAVLAFIYFQIFTMLKSQLEPEGLLGWGLVIGLLAGAALLFGGYAGFTIIRKRRVHFFLAPLILVSYIAYFYLLGFRLETMLPFDTPPWVISHEQFLIYTGTFIIPALFYAILRFVKGLDRLLVKQRIWVNILGALLVPALWYLFYNLLLNFARGFHYSKFGTHGVIFLAIVLSVLFYFFLIRAAFLIYRRRKKMSPILTYLWKFFFALLLPLLGICLNEMWFPFSLLKAWSSFPDNFHVIFGDLSNPLFPILQIVTGLLLLVPPLRQRELRLALFVARTALFSYTFYLFLALMPFYPIFIAAILLFGTGLLIISPLTMIAIHFQTLREDLAYLKERVSLRVLAAIMAGTIMILPLLVTGSFLLERTNLYKALDYLYAPNYSGQEEVKIDRKRLTRTLLNIEKGRDEGRGGLFGESYNTPYLSPIYRKLVLNNLTLSDDKLNYLRKFYLNIDEQKKSFINEWERLPEQMVKLSDLQYKTEFDPEEGLYHTWIELTLTNEGWGNNEYTAHFELPEGAWIEDYYLDIFGERVPGMLVEKKAAQWIYQEVRRRRRDPGLIFYQTERRLNLRIFPFAKDEVRYSGFKIVHFEPLKLSFDGVQVVTNGGQELFRPVISHNERSAYLSSGFKESLEKVSRLPYYHFILDFSERGGGELDFYLEEIGKFLAENPLSGGEPMVTLAGYNNRTMSLKEASLSGLESFKPAGAFALDRALKTIYYADYMEGDLDFPLPVVISRREVIESALYDNTLHELAFAFPDSPYFYFLSGDRKMVRYPLLNFSLAAGRAVEEIEFEPVRLWRQGEELYFLPDNDEGSLVLLDRRPELRPELIETELRAEQSEQSRLLNISWLRRRQLLFPYQEESLWMVLYRESIRQHLLTPLTTFIVLENETQRKALLKKEKETLTGKKSLDTNAEKLEDAQEMSEPSLIIGVIVLALLVLVFKRRRRRGDRGTAS